MEDLKKLYKELLNLTETQKEVIEEENYEKLLDLLDEKEEIMDKIDNIDFQEYFQQAEEPKVKFNKIQDLMQEIKTLEEENMEKVKEGHSRMKKKLKDINEKEKSRQGYQNLNSMFDAKFIDEKR